MSDTTPCYVAKYPECGCAVACYVDAPDMAHVKDYRGKLFRQLSTWERQGLTVELVTVEAARTLVHSCPHQAEKPSRKRKAATR